MDDISLLIVKPEIMLQKEKIFEYLRKRGYSIIYKQELNNWQGYAKKLYAEFTEQQISVYLDSYKKNGWGDTFLVLILKHKAGNTIVRLKSDEGNYISYQTEKENTLRAEFGLWKEKNMFCNGITFTYNGFHSAKDQSELKQHLKILKIKLE